MSINSWSTITVDNYMDKVKDCEKHGPLRLQLALHLQPILNDSKITWFLDTGTLMGAYRDGKMLKHDDDFDIGICCNDIEYKKLFNLIKTNIDPKYKVRLISSYTTKLEVYDESYGKYNFGQDNKYDYHNVTIDIQLYLLKNNGKVVTTYKKDEYDKNTNLHIDMISPTKTILYENYYFNCPNDAEAFLKAHYGYIGPNALYNTETKKYEPSK